MNLNKWYWKLLIIAVLCLVLFTVLSVVGGIFAILFRFCDTDFNWTVDCVPVQKYEGKIRA